MSAIIGNFKNILARKYFCFEGRASRAEFWYWALACLIISIVLIIVDLIIGFGILELLFDLAVLLPGLGVSVRRLHDINMSGWLLLLSLTLIGAIILLIFFAQEGQRGENQYGPEPGSGGIC